MKSPPTMSSTSPSRWIDMSAVMAVNNLQWRAKTIVNGFNKGIHRSRNHGFSVEFSEYRPFSEGDDLRSVDWKLYARSDRLYIKKFEDETNRRCFVLLDQSSSMKFSTLSFTKSDFANTLAATLSYYWLNQRDATGLISFTDRIREIHPAQFRPGQLKRILSSIDQPTAGTRTDLSTPLTQTATWNHRRSLLVVISDFLIPANEVRSSLASISAKKHDVVLVQILDPAETHWTQEAPTMVRDLESGNEMFVDPVTVTKSYTQKFSAHQAAWKTLAEDLGMRWFPIQTDNSLDRVLLQLVTGKF